MKSPEMLRGAYQRMWPQQGSPGVSSHIWDISGWPGLLTDYLGALREETSGVTQLPDLSEETPVVSAIDVLAFAQMCQDVPKEIRRQAVDAALDRLTKETVLGTPTLHGVDMRAAYERAQVLSSQAVSLVAEGIASYPAKPEKLWEMRDGLAALLYPESRTEEDRTVAALAMFDMVRPYLVERFLELNLYDTEDLAKQIRSLRSDFALLQRFSRSASGLSEIMLTGKTAKTAAEVADELFDIGPIYAQLAQSYSSAAHKASDEGGVNPRAFLSDVARAMQEGVAMPSEAQVLQLSENLPEGLRLSHVFSSAKIAYVANTEASGQGYVTKIKRPNSEQALKDNQRIFMLLSACGASYVEAHTGVATMSSINIARNWMPFYVDAIANDMRQEDLDFRAEVRAQRHGAAVLAAHPGIIVPEIVDRYSNDDTITMHPVPGERVSDVLAHPDHLKNMMILMLSGYRQRFVHGDMHAANIKVAANETGGTLVAYDWGSSIELPPRFGLHLAQFLGALAIKRPKAIASTYRRIQSINHTQITQEEAEAVARTAIRTANDVSEARAARGTDLRGVRRRIKDTKNLLRFFVANVGIEHQSAPDTRYMRFMRSAASLYAIAGAELRKPEYENRRYRRRVIFDSARAALREVRVSERKRA